MTRRFDHLMLYLAAQSEETKVGHDPDKVQEQFVKDYNAVIDRLNRSSLVDKLLMVLRIKKRTENTRPMGVGRGSGTNDSTERS